jgi:hypothetical protein
MGILFPAAELIKQTAISLWEDKMPMSLLSFSHQDFLLSPSEWEQFLNPSDFPGMPKLEPLSFLTDSEDIANWHKSHSFAPKIPDAHNVYARLGFSKITDVDLVKARKDEIIADLNYPLPAQITQHSLVLDNVSQHCFNVGTAMTSIRNCVALNGYVVHVLPLTMLQQGYITISPDGLRDFYEQAGFTVKHHIAFCRNKLEHSYQVMHLNNAVRESPGDGWSQVFVARKTKKIKNPGWPLQEKFRKFPNSSIGK